MPDHAKTIERFYGALGARDPETMAAIYADDVTFSDPVFQDLRGERARGMWRMLASRAKDITIELSGVHVEGDRGRAHWEARYTFSATGRAVHNVIDAAFVFEGDRVKDHKDTFDLWRWSRMALGPPGVLLGWSPILQGKIRKNAQAGLDAWMAAGAAGAKQSAG